MNKLGDCGVKMSREVVVWGQPGLQSLEGLARIHFRAHSVVAVRTPDSWKVVKGFNF